MKAEEILKQLGGVAGERGIAAGDHLDRQTLQTLRNSSTDEENRRRIEAHLASCDKCLDLVTTFEAEEPALSPGQFRRIMASTESRTSRQSWLAWGGIPVMVAALVLVIFWPGGQDGVGPYSSTLRGQAAEIRGEEGQGEVFTPDTNLVFQVMPQGAAPAQPPEVALFFHTPTGQWLRGEVNVEVDPISGVLTARIPAADILGQEFGTWQSVLVLSPAGQPLPAGEEPPQAPDDNLRVLRHTFTYVPSAVE